MEYIHWVALSQRDMKELFNYIQGNFAWAVEEGMTGPSRYLVQPHNYCIPRVEYYPLTHNWVAKAVIEDMEPSLDPALVVARTKMDLAFQKEIEKIIYKILQPDMKEFLNYIQGNFAWVVEEGMTGPFEYLVQPHNYCIPQVEYYPLTHNWFAKAVIEDMEPSLDLAFVAARIEMDLAFPDGLQYHLRCNN